MHMQLMRCNEYIQVIIKLPSNSCFKDLYGDSVEYNIAFLILDFILFFSLLYFSFMLIYT